MNLSKLSRLAKLLWSPPTARDGAVEFIKRHYDPYQMFSAPEYEEFLVAVKRGKKAAALAKYQKIYSDSTMVEALFAAILARQLIA